MKLYVVEGGFGRNIFFTPLISELAKDEKILIMSSYPDVFENNPRVYRSLARNTPYAWDDFIMKSDTEVIFSDPYFNGDFIRGKTHVIEAWCDELNLDYDKDKMKPQLFLGNNYFKDAKKFKEENGNFIIVQFTCGQSVYNMNTPNPQPFVYEGFQRKISKENAQWIIDFIHDAYPALTIVNMAFPNEDMNLKHTIMLQAPTIFYAALLKESEGFIGINSCLTHMAAAMDKKGVVLWGGTSSKSWGYEKDINLNGKCSQDTLFCSRPYLRDLGDFNSSGAKWMCPNPTCMDLDAEEVFNGVDSLLDLSLKKYLADPNNKKEMALKAEKTCEGNCKH